ncbi:hypothetical protein LEN26_015793 [Aphanomyces euteiches]|nr:hypothetical protein LEN26_015793 [Aphanomyces euteiches]
MEKTQHDANRHRGSNPMVLLADIAKMQLSDWTKNMKSNAADQASSMRQAASRARAKAKAEKEKRAKARLVNPNVIRAKAANQLMQEELAKLMKDVNVLLRKERRNLPQWIRTYKDDDPRCVIYHSMLRRVGLPERHARFAPWFLKSDQLVLNKYGQKLFQKFEDAYMAREARLGETEAAVKSHQAFEARIASLELSPREKNQSLLQRAFRECSFPPPKLQLSTRQQEHPLLINPDGNEEEAEPVALETKYALDDPTVKPIPIPQVKLSAAPPGLAPAVPGKLESHGKHKYHNYNGRWKDGEMRGALGVYTFADGGTYTGAWKDSLQCGQGTATYPNGVTYQGQWKDGKYHGHGVYTSPHAIYTGMWFEGMRHGHGHLKMASGATYDGEFFRNQRHGRGVETSPLGYKYKGNFRMNRIYGAGHIEIVLDDGKVHIYAKDNWEQCVLGEAAMEAKLHWMGIHDEEEIQLRRLVRIRDDLRAHDLQENFHLKERQRLIDEEKAQKQARREANREKREALARAKEAFQNRIMQDQSSSSDDKDEKHPQDGAAENDKEKSNDEEDSDDDEDNDDEEGEEEDDGEEEDKADDES